MVGRPHTSGLLSVVTEDDFATTIEHGMVVIDVPRAFSANQSRLRLDLTSDGMGSQ